MSDLNIMAIVLSAAIVNYVIRVTPFLMTFGKFLLRMGS